MKEGYKKTEVGVIPEEWEVKKLGQVCSIKGRVGWKGYNKSDLRDEGALTLGAMHISKDNKLDLSSPIYLCEEKYEESPEIKVKQGDIILSQRGSLGKVALINKNIGKATINPSMVLLKDIVINNTYLSYWLMSNYIQKIIFSNQSQTSIPMISQSQINDFLVIIPKLKEQEKIAEILSTVDSQIDDTEKLIEKSKELKKGLMQKLLTKGIGHSEFKKTEVGEIPVSWEVKKFKDLTDILRCGVASTPRYVEEGVMFLSAQNVQESGLSLHKYNYISEEYHKKLTKNDKPQPGDILYSRVGANYGIATVVDIDIEFSIYVSLTLIRMKKGYDSNFYKYLLNSSICKKQADIGVFQGAGVPNLNVKIVENFKMIVPPLDEQIKIANILEYVDLQIEKYKLEKQKFEELKKGLMQQLLTGKIRMI